MSVSAPIPELRTEETPPLYRDVRVLRWVGQLAVVFVVFGFLYWLGRNFSQNMEAKGLDTGFGWLQTRWGSDIAGLPEAPDYTNAVAFLHGIKNTFYVIALGIPGCTIIGILIGIARLSNNLMVRAFGTLYVEAFRNIPALVWVFIAYNSIALAALPQISEATTGFGFVLSNRAIGIPFLNPEASRSTFILMMIVALVVVWAVNKWRAGVNAKTGAPAHGLLYGTLAFIAMMIVAHFVSGGALAIEGSALSENGLRVDGGMTVQIPYFALTVALTLYTASHVAEVVRGAILAIHAGQGEAASAIALSTFQRYRFVILPQAFRIMIPPLANQYLNITKNSSLAVAISYIEIAAVFERLSNNSAPATSVIMILMIAYLSFSLTISMIANFFNRRLSLESR